MPGRDLNYCPMCASPLTTAERGGRERQVCPAEGCGFVDWNNPVPVVAAIVEHAGSVILVRSRGLPETWFGLVAGFLEPDESPEQGVLREIEEEIGIAAENADYLGAYPFSLRNQIIFCYHVEVPHADIRLCEEELSGFRKVPLAELKPWSRGTGPALRDWLIARGYAPETVEFGQHVEP